MSLVIDVATKQYVCQVSDRRTVAAYLPPIIDSDDFPKCLYIFCRDAHFALTVIGKSYVLKSPVSVWIARELSKFGAPFRNVDDIIAHVRHVLIESLHNLWSATEPEASPSIAISHAGYRFIKHGNETFVHAFSGFSSSRINAVRTIIDVPEEIVRMCGRVDIADPALEKRLRQMIKHRKFHNGTAKETSRALLSIIRAASDHKEEGIWVGKKCLSVRIFPETAAGAHFLIHDVGKPDRWATPIILSPRSAPVELRAEGDPRQVGGVRLTDGLLEFDGDADNIESRYVQ